MIAESQLEFSFEQVAFADASSGQTSTADTVSRSEPGQAPSSVRTGPSFMEKEFLWFWVGSAIYVREEATFS